jgi:tRNA A37 threonylcarbamoyladenosine biosynthesis protein TsaE
MKRKQVFLLYFSHLFCNFVANMITDELKYRIREAFLHVPTREQEHAIDIFSLFMTDRHEQAVMIMRGSAGTGKTTLAAAVVKAMMSLKQKMVLLAPTGRAAKVFSLYAGHPAYTIHRRIYRQKSLEGAFDLNYNNAQDTLYIIDEASMIANASNYGDTPFAQGQLLDDLIQFVYNGRNCRMLLIGDQAQLPPVGEEESPALSAQVLRGYGMRVYETDLNQVLRQSEDSGILWNATQIRAHSAGPSAGSGTVSMPRIRFQGFTDIQVVTSDELIDTLSSSYYHAGMDETIVITRSNKRANIYNQGIRNMVLDRDDELCRGDLLMIVKNNYFWTEGSKEIPFLANGDRAVVQRVRHVHELYGFRFAEVTMTLPDYDDYDLTATVCLDTLTTEAPALTREQQEQLYQAVLEDYADITQKTERIKKLKSDRYYNALQVKFSYAVTCHKAQGGQWAHVYLDQGYMTDDMLTPDYIHWLYTAFTRATEKLYLVNWPSTQKQ